MKNVIVFTLFCVVLISCKKPHPPLNVVFQNESSENVAKYIQGSWKLNYEFGGIEGMKYMASGNSYMRIEPGTITFWNDSSRLVRSAILTIEKVTSIYGYDAYSLSYKYSPADQHSELKILNQIKNDTLIISDNVVGGFTYYYTKN